MARLLPHFETCMANSLEIDIVKCISLTMPESTATPRKGVIQIMAPDPVEVLGAQLPALLSFARKAFSIFTVHSAAAVCRPVSA